VKKYNPDFICNTAVVLAVSLASIPALATDENPFQTRDVKRNATIDQRLAYCMSGRCGGNWEGRCGGMMDGMMMGGAMPPALDPAELPEPDTTGAKLVAQYCTQCHSLPSPKQHTAAGWPATVVRMNTRMQWMSQNNSTMNITAPTSDELAILNAYMAKHASSADDNAGSGDPSSQ